MENLISDDIVILRSVYSKTPIKIITQPARDPKTKRLPDHVKHVNANGDMILTEKELNSNTIFIKETQTFVLEDGTTFNLSDPYQKAEWEAIKYCPLIAQARDARDANGKLIIDGDTKAPTYETRNTRRYGIAELYVERPGVESQKRVSKKKRVIDACNYIYNDEKGAQGRLNMAKLLGRFMRNAPDADVTDYLLTIAEKDPERITSLYTSEELPLRMLIVDAKEKHIIYARNKAYWYGDDQLLGATDEAVFTKLKNPDFRSIREVITKETYPDLYKVDKK